MVSNPLFYWLAGPSILLLGVSKGGLGGGLGLLAMPVLSLVIGPAQTAAVMLPILCAMDVIGVAVYRRLWDAENMRIILPGAVVGIGIGALTFRFVSEQVLDVLVGTIAVGFAAQAWLGLGSSRAPRGPNFAAGSFWAALSGYTSCVANTGSPPLSIYLLPQRLDKTLYVGTTVIFFAIVNLLKLPAYLELGLFTPGNLATSLVLLPLAPVGMLLGVWAHKRLKSGLFYQICYVLLVATGSKLVWEGLFASGGLLAR